MENSEIKKQFRITLYEDEILITTPTNRKEAFEAKINVPHEIKIGWHRWIETEHSALNYPECCGVMILFGIAPPSFSELYRLLS